MTPAKLDAANWRDAYGNGWEKIVAAAVCGIVNSSPEAFRYDPDAYPPLAIRTALNRLPSHYAKPRPATTEDLLVEECRILAMCRDHEHRDQIAISEERISYLRTKRIA